VVGYLLRKHNFEPASLVLGLVLGPIMERSLLQALTIEQGKLSGLWASPVSATILLLALLAASLPLLSRLPLRMPAALRQSFSPPPPRPDA
jgi:putative tricarboxylic transport membrane protein